MTQYDKYHIFMKMLEIIEQDDPIGAGTVTEERLTQITNVIARLEGNIVQEQSVSKEIVMQGDNFQNVSQSIIATRGSIAEGVINVRTCHGDAVADALQDLEAAIAGEPGENLAEQTRKEALELLAEMAQQGGKPDAPKSVIRSLGQTLWGLIEKVEPLSKACLAAWKVVERLWT